MKPIMCIHCGREIEYYTKYSIWIHKVGGALLCVRTSATPPEGTTTPKGE